MSMIFQFRALSDENDRFIRDYEVLYDSSLLAFHHFICDDLNFDPQAITSFFQSDRLWSKLLEFTSVDMGVTEENGSQPMEDVRIGQLITDVGNKLIYTFDPFGDRSLFMEMTGTYKAEDGVSYPRTVLSEEDAPGQFDPAAAMTDNSIFAEAMNDFSDFEGDDNYDDDF